MTLRVCRNIECCSCDCSSGECAMISAAVAAIVFVGSIVGLIMLNTSYEQAIADIGARATNGLRGLFITVIVLGSVTIGVAGSAICLCKDKLA